MGRGEKSALKSSRMEKDGKMTKRPGVYNYFEELKDHLRGDTSRIFDGTLVYPRQLEIHLPGNGKIPCLFHCLHCQGSRLMRSLGNWEEKGLRLLSKLNGKVPLHVYGGAYTEPLLNKYILDYLCLTKKTGSNFGVHTNGALLMKRQMGQKFLENICRIATSPKDYVSISLDAGCAESHSKTKGLEGNSFDTIIAGIRALSWMKGMAKWPSIRIVYLMNSINSSGKEIEDIVKLSQDIGVNSLRFSIPYDVYGKSFDSVREYKRIVENELREEYYKRVEPYLTDAENEKTKIFWISPDSQDVDRMDFDQCIYSYFQITLAADGYVYRCSSTASPSFKFCRLGKITDDLESFKDMILANHNSDWKPETCFSHGARCNRLSLEINEEWSGKK